MCMTAHLNETLFGKFVDHDTVFLDSLLLEDSDAEEGDLCRICQMGETSNSNPLIEPCRCTGSLQYVHQDCIKKWLRSKISSGKYLSFPLLINPLTWSLMIPSS